MIKAVEFYRASVADAAAPVEAWRGFGLALMRSGQNAEGQMALKKYLERKPDAPDRAMMAMMAGVQS